MKRIKCRKKIISLILITAMLLAWTPVNYAATQTDAPSWDEWVAATKTTQELSDCYLDAQGVYYTLDTSAKTAMVGIESSATSLENASQYSGANDGICIIPEKVRYNGTEYEVIGISPRGFFNNLNLKTLIVADTVDTIGADTFYNCTLRYLYIGNACLKGSASEYSLFSSTNRFLKEIRMSEDNDNYNLLDGVLYSKDMTWLLACPGLREGNCLATYEVPDGVTNIAGCAFESCAIRRIVLPESVKTIGEQAFIRCAQLETIDLEHVTSVGRGAFVDCDKLRTVNLPASSYTLEYHAIGYAGKVEALLYKKSSSQESASAFCEWKELKTLVVQEGTTQIVQSAFKNCKNLDTVILPDTVTILKSNSFSNCPKLKRLYIPSSVTTISTGVLKGNDTVIYGTAGSAAQTYAKDNEFTFVDVSAQDHSNLQAVTVFENPYIRVTADYCKQCVYASNVEFTIKESGSPEDETDGIYPFRHTLTKTVRELDENNRDEQGVVYKLMNQGCTEAIALQLDDGAGVSDVVIPEKVKKDGVEYAVTSIASGFSESERITSLVIPDTVEEIQSLASETLKYIYIGANVSDLEAKIFSAKVKGIEVSSANLDYYVKDSVLYQRDGEVVYDFSEEAGTEQGTTEQKTTTEQQGTTETKTEESESGGSSTGEQGSGEQKSSRQSASEQESGNQNAGGQSTDGQQAEQPDAGSQQAEQTDAGSQTAQNPAAAPTTPGRVGGVALASKNGKHICLSWSAVEAASGYEIYRSARKNKGYRRIADVTGDRTTYTDKKAKKYKTYYYKVYAVSGNEQEKETGAPSAAKKYCASGMQEPSLTVKKKALSSGTPYLQVKCSGASGTRIELYCKKGKSRWKKIKLRASRLTGHTKILNIGYRTGSGSLQLKLRTCKKVKGKYYYSEYSESISVTL